MKDFNLSVYRCRLKLFPFKNEYCSDFIYECLIELKCLTTFSTSCTLQRKATQILVRRTVSLILSYISVWPFPKAKKIH
jgi:hypothetical protein